MNLPSVSEKGDMGPVLVSFWSLNNGEEAAISLWLLLLLLPGLLSTVVLQKPRSSMAHSGASSDFREVPGWLLFF